MDLEKRAWGRETSTLGVVRTEVCGGTEGGVSGKRKGSRWKCWASNATESSKRDGGWDEAIGICHYKATNDLRGSHPVERQGREGVAPWGVKKHLESLGVQP